MVGGQPPSLSHFHPFRTEVKFVGECPLSLFTYQQLERNLISTDQRNMNLWKCRISPSDISLLRSDLNFLPSGHLFLSALYVQNL